MDYLHPTMQAALAPFSPKPVETSFNDDDIYIIDLHSKMVAAIFGRSSASYQAARAGGMTVQIGQALVTGMTAKYLVGAA